MTDDRYDGWEPRRVETCAVCGGAISRRTNAAAPIGYVDPRAPWLHVYESDWIDAPHDGEPASSSITPNPIGPTGFPRPRPIR